MIVITPLEWEGRIPAEKRKVFRKPVWCVGVVNLCGLRPRRAVNNFFFINEHRSDFGVSLVKAPCNVFANRAIAPSTKPGFPDVNLVGRMMIPTCDGWQQVKQNHAARTHGWHLTAGGLPCGNDDRPSIDSGYQASGRDGVDPDDGTEVLHTIGFSTASDLVDLVGTECGEQMAETFEEYRDRVLSYLGDRGPIGVLMGTADNIDCRLGDVAPEDMIRRPVPENWSIAEIVAHLADAELAFAWRLRNMLANPGVALSWWDEAAWSKHLNYEQQEPAFSAKVFRILRESNLRLLESVPRLSWVECYGVHQVRGRQTVVEFVQMEAAHDLNHLQQIDRILDRSMAGPLPLRNKSLTR